MDIQGYTPQSEASQTLTYANVERFDLSPSPNFKKPDDNNTPLLTPSSMPNLLSKLPDYVPPPVDAALQPTSTSVVPPVIKDETLTLSTTDVKEETNYAADPLEQVDYAANAMKNEMQDFIPTEASMDPVLLLRKYDKRKSSPAILGLPFDLSNDDQMSLHLSQQRNSIEAAMLLANFNRLPTLDAKPGDTQWQDDMSLPMQTQDKTAWVNENDVEAIRRHSYDVNMNWKSMPESFLNRPDLLSTAPVTSASSSQPLVNASGDLYASTTSVSMPSNATKVTWSNEDVLQPPSMDYSQLPAANSPRSLPPPPSASSVGGYRPPPFPSHMYPQPMYSAGGYPPPRPMHHHMSPDRFHPLAPSSIHPLASPRDIIGQKRDHPVDEGYYVRPHYPPTASSPPPPPPHYAVPQPHQPPPVHPHYFYPGKLPIPTSGSAMASSMVADMNHPALKPKRKRARMEDNNEEEIPANENEFPDMSPRDIEAARNDPEARPRKQKLRFPGDHYTPQWVRYNGQAKEGLCDTCQPGKWLQLKNSAFWYHKQFYHGISSVSGKEFVQPLETRWVDQDLVEGLCHQCHQWVAVSNVKRKNSVLWYRHAHKCHVYQKPKNSAPKKR
ncbi:uncharacterized protein BYT42DRAFT_559763 [Radiomyces spectabilis]|uniref:uncharacterized protein n=1 Tax=Radiomyces spectabilis TaxID=64574 RepID=UPI00221E4468|nr:uncharacterized protein BYT42DRAFT_559763 [Radiomyces spectabilis]KAI8388340.1 hypothetical protein BYT42DRAFT_559763 [Radiomyces spectabilis]